MDGTIAQLDRIVSLAEQYDAMIMVDECHASGFMGKTGRGTHEFRGVMGRIDIITGTLGKALGGAMGGFTSGRKEVVELLRQRSRPYLFSNTLMPAIVGASIAVLDMLSSTTSLRDKLDAVLAQNMAAKLLEEGIYVTGFFYPVVPKGQARIRVQISAAHEQQHLEKAVDAFVKIGRELGVVK
jgi:glycine C-acetyltransferase